MDNPVNNNYLPQGERIAILETKVTEINTTLQEIKDQLNDLLELKHRGMGAFTLVTILVGSGLLGLVFTVVQFFSKPHI